MKNFDQLKKKIVNKRKSKDYKISLNFCKTFIIQLAKNVFSNLLNRLKLLKKNLRTLVKNL